jgi:hypothetical protein
MCLGAQAGEPRIRNVATRGGFTRSGVPPRHRDAVQLHNTKHEFSDKGSGRSAARVKQTSKGPPESVVEWL